MIYTNTLYRTFYIAQNFTTGLTDITVHITMPSGLSAGAFTMTELAARPGVYYYDYYVISGGRYLFDADSVSMPNRSASVIDAVDQPQDDRTIPIAYFDNL